MKFHEKIKIIKNRHYFLKKKNRRVDLYEIKEK